MSRHISPYHAPGFYDEALANGRHRDIVGGRWDETGLIQMQIVLNGGVEPHHQFLDIGAGSLRLGCRLVPYMQPGHYWATDLSGALMRAGRMKELADPDRLPEDHLIEDANFDFPRVPDSITHVMAFAVFTHLPVNHLRRMLFQVHRRFPRLERMFVTVFLAPDGEASLSPVRQPDGVVTHDTRAPYHMLAEEVELLARLAGFEATRSLNELPRGQVLYDFVRA